MVVIGSTRKLAFNTTTLLAGLGTYTSTPIDVTNYKTNNGLCYSDVAGSIAFQYSMDGTNWDTASTQAVAAATVVTCTTTNFLKFFRVVYTNGAAGQATFRFAMYCAPL